MKRKYYENIKLRLEIVKKVKGKIIIDAFIETNALILDFYVQIKRGKCVEIKPLFRTVVEEKDFGNYNFEQRVWNGKIISNQIRECEVLREKIYEYDLLKDAMYTECGKQIIKDFCSESWRQDPIGKISNFEESIAGDRREKVKVNHFVKVQELMKLLPNLEKGFEKNVFQKYFKNDHIFYYKTKEKKGWCSRCGYEVELRKRKKHNEEGFCPRCKQKVTFKTRQNAYERKKEILYMQPYEGKMVLRYYKAALWSAVGKKENFEITESVRTYHGESIEDYENRYIHYFDNMNGENFWDDKMSFYRQVKYGQKTVLYGNNLQEVRKYLKAREYTPLEEMAENCEEVKIIEILLHFKDGTIYEKLYKMGLKKIAFEYLSGNYNRNTICKEGKTVKQILGISKTKLAFLRENNGNYKMLMRLQDAEKENYKLSEDKIFEIVKEEIYVEEVAGLAKKNKVLKMLHYLKKQTCYKTLKETLTHYRDYKGMATALRYDFEIDTICYPANLKEKHDRITKEFYQEESDKHIREKMKQYYRIQEYYFELEEELGYSEKQFIITVAKNAGEIIVEGRTLHHCVGGDNYLKNHNEKRKIICFLRKKQEEQVPYYTIEIDLQTKEIYQYYGKNDKKPDKDIVDEWLHKWKRELKKRSNKNKKELLRVAG